MKVGILLIVAMIVGTAGCARSRVQVSDKQISPVQRHPPPSEEWFVSVDCHEGAGLVAAVTFGGDLAVWDFREQKLLRQWRGSEKYLTTVAFSPDGRMIAAGAGSTVTNAERTTVTLWDVKSGRELKRIDTGLASGEVQSMAFSPDGRLVAWEVFSGFDESLPFHKVVVYDTKSEQTTSVYVSRGGGSARFLSNERLFAASSLWAVRRTPSLAIELERTTPFQFLSADGSTGYVVHGGKEAPASLLPKNAFVEQFDVATGRRTHTWTLLKTRSWGIRDFDVSSDNHFLALPTTYGAYLLDLKENRPLVSLDDIGDANSIRFFAGGRLAAGGGQYGLMIWRLPEGTRNENTRDKCRTR